jgi:hypothetical protein
VFSRASVSAPRGAFTFQPVRSFPGGPRDYKSFRRPISLTQEEIDLDLEWNRFGRVGGFGKKKSR